MSYLIKSYINRSHSGDKNMTSRLCLSGGHVTKLSFQTESPMFAGQSTSGTKRKENSMEYFVKIPNNFIKCDIEKDFDVTPSFYVVYYLLNNNRSIRNQSFISIKEIMDIYSAKCTSRKPKIFNDIVKSINKLEELGLIRSLNTPSVLRYESFLKYQICDAFDPSCDFTIFTEKELLNIMKIDSAITKDTLLRVYLYIKANIIKRSYHQEETLENPEAFFKNIKVSAEEIGIHYNTFYGTIEELCKGENPLLIKSNIIHRSSKNSPICSPRVIVINKVGWKKELQGAVSILKNNPGWEKELLAANALLERK